MNERYSVGFKDKGISCFWVEDNPGRVPIVDLKSLYVNGVCIALADDEVYAKLIVDALNLKEQLEN